MNRSSPYFNPYIPNGYYPYPMPYYPGYPMNYYYYFVRRHPEEFSDSDQSDNANETLNENGEDANDYHNENGQDTNNSIENHNQTNSQANNEDEANDENLFNHQSVVLLGTQLPKNKKISREILQYGPIKQIARIQGAIIEFENSKSVVDLASQRTITIEDQNITIVAP